MSLNNTTTTQMISVAKAIADCLPVFDGDSGQLESFIFRCDKFYTSYECTTDNGVNDYCFNAIRSKLKGNVINFLMCRPDLTTWPLIKTSLREHFGDKTDRQTLTRECLQLAKTKTETTPEFLKRLKIVKSRVEVKIQTHPQLTAEQKALLIGQNELNALDVLAANSDNTLRLLLDIKQPNTLANASDIVLRHHHNEIRINTLILNQNTQATPKSNPSTKFPPKNVPYKAPYGQFVHMPHPYPPIPVQTKPVARNFPTNQQVFGKPRTPSNVFSPKNSHKPIAPPEHLLRNLFRKTGPSNIVVEELHNTEYPTETTPDEYDEYQYPNSEQYPVNEEYYVESSDFQNFRDAPDEKQYRIELNNITTTNSLPFIQLKTIPVKLLIDTGCHGFLLRPYIAEKYFPESICLSLLGQAQNIQFGTVFNRDKFECFHIDSPQTVTDRANGISLQNQKPGHLNSEEKRMLGKVMTESPEILRDNSNKLTFTNKIKHNIIYKKGRCNTNADALSRVEIHPLEIADNESTAVNLDDQDLSDLSVEDINAILDDIQHQKPPNGNTRSENIPGTSANQNGIIHVESAPREPNENTSVDDTVHTALENPTVTLPYTEKSLNVHANQIIIEYARPGQTYCVYFKFAEMEKPLIRFIQNYSTNKTFALIISRTILEDITGREQQEKVKLYHETKTSHRGITENISAIKKHVRNYVNSCEICQKSKYERHPSKLIFKPTPIGSKPFEHIYIDSFKVSNQSFVTIIDSFSKFGQAYPITSLNAIETANKVIQYFSRFGIPMKITCDNGNEFRNKVFQDLCNLYEIELHYVTAYNSNSNSTIERFHSSILEAIRIVREEKANLNIQDLMNFAILSYNNSIHSDTEYTPFQIAKGQVNLKNPFELTKNEQISNYITEHTQILELLSNQLSKTPKRKQTQTLERENRHRKQSLTLNVEQPLYSKNNKKTQKDQQPFVKLNDPKTIDDNTIISNDKVTYQRQLKPQRKLTVAGKRHDDNTDSSTDTDDNIPLSRICNPSRHSKQPDPSATIRQSPRN
ncbi:hypothetical protein Trydic_g7487 [Trypoxylus dichotomus]